MKQKLVIIGINQTALNLCDFVTYHNLFEVIGFSVDREYITGTTILEKPIYPLEELDLHIDKAKVGIFVAILWNKLNSLRRKVYEELDSKGYMFANIISPTAVLLSNNIGRNCWIRDYVVVRPDSKIGDNCIIEDFTLIGTESQIGSHCFCGVRSLIAGGCKIGEQSFVGVGSTLLEAVEVGTKCIIGAGSVVKRNLPNNSVIKVNSENYIIKQYLESEIEGKLDITKRIR